MVTGCLGSGPGSVIQATGRTDFEDGLRIGNQSEAGNSLQRVRTIPENKGIIVLRHSARYGQIFFRHYLTTFRGGWGVKRSSKHQGM